MTEVYRHRAQRFASAAENVRKRVDVLERLRLLLFLFFTLTIIAADFFSGSRLQLGGLALLILAGGVMAVVRSRGAR